MAKNGKSAEKRIFFHGSSRRPELYEKPLSVLTLDKKKIGLAPTVFRFVFHRSTLLSFIFAQI